MDAETRSDVLQRWAYVGGHLDGIRGMVEQDARCVHVARQAYAVRRAIRKVESEILEWHVRRVLGAAVAAGEPDRALEELISLYGLADRPR